MAKSKEEIAEYKKQWAIKNIEKVKEQRRNFYLKNSDRIKELSKKRGIEKSTELKKYKSEYYKKNKLETKSDNEISVYALVSKFMGFPCRAKEMSVREFNNYLKLAKNG